MPVLISMAIERGPGPDSSHLTEDNQTISYCSVDNTSEVSVKPVVVGVILL